MDLDGGSGEGGPREVRLIDLREGQFPVIVRGRVVRAERRVVRRRSDASETPALVGFLTDGSATVRFTWWDPPEESVDAGDGLRAGPVGIREFRGRIELSFGRRTRVEPIGRLELPSALLEERASRAVASLRPGDDDVRIDAEVDRCEGRSRTVRGVERPFFVGTLRDASGEIPFVAWIDLGLEGRARVRLAGGYVRSYRDRPELVLDERTEVRSLDVDRGPAPGAEARIRRAVAAAPVPPGPEPFGAAAWADRIAALAAASPDGYVRREELAGAAEEPGTRGIDLDEMVRYLLRSGAIVEPLAGLLRPLARPVGD